MTRPARMARAAVFAAVCLAVSAAGHAWMSGRPVPGIALVPGFLLAFLLALAVAGRPRGFALLATLMLAGEALEHLLFTAAQHIDTGGSAAAASTSTPDMPGMPMPGMPGMAAAPTSPHGGAGMSIVMHYGAAGMIAVHAAAGLVCAWWLHRGERAFLALLARAAGEAVARLLPAAPAAAHRVAAAEHDFALADRVCAPCFPKPLIHVLVRRGPPAPRSAA